MNALKLRGAKVVALLSDNITPPERLACCDATICVAENVYERAAQRLPKSCRVHYIPFPFEPPRSTRREVRRAGTNRPYFLFLGCICREKGVDVLLDAFPAFQQDHPEYQLLLAGPIRDASLPRMAGSEATFLGEVDRASVAALIEQAEALVLPSRSEGLPRACLEAIALGTKVICPPGVPELERACPECVLSDVTPQALLKKLGETRASASRGSFDFGKHDPRIVGERFLDVCTAVLRNGA